MDLHEKVKLTRVMKNLSQYDVAFMTDNAISQTEISYFERGKRRGKGELLSKTKLDALLEALELK